MDSLVRLQFQKSLAQLIRKSGVKGVELLRAIQGDHSLHVLSVLR